jgi:rubrerythrin
VKILHVLDRCITIERTAAEIYEILAARSVRDDELRAFWSRMAADERTHARNLETYRAIVAAEDRSHPTLAEGFESDLVELESLVSEARARAAVADSSDDAFAIALDLELSELDTIYTTLLQSSPLTRVTSAAGQRRSDITSHHAALVGAIRSRSLSEDHLTRAALIAARD